MEIFPTDKVTADSDIGAPAFPPLRATPASVSDTGKVRMGYGSSPFQIRVMPKSIKYTGKVLIGFGAPPFQIRV